MFAHVKYLYIYLIFFKRNEMAHLPTQTSLPLIYTTMYSFQFEIAVNKHYCRKFEVFFLDLIN